MGSVLTPSSVGSWGRKISCIKCTTTIKGHGLRDCSVRAQGGSCKEAAAGGMSSTAGKILRALLCLYWIWTECMHSCSPVQLPSTTCQSEKEGFLIKLGLFPCCLNVRLCRKLNSQTSPISMFHKPPP